MCDPDVIFPNKLLLRCLEHASAFGCMILPIMCFGKRKHTRLLQGLLIPLRSVP